VAGTQSNPPSWGLPRISSRTSVNVKPLPAYNYLDSAGAGVDVFVLDTGIQINQTDFGGRASVYYDYYPTEPGPDGYGHGTHVAGTIGSNTYGVAKAVTLHSIRVLDDTGSGYFSTVIAGMELVVNWVAANKAGQSKLSTIISMSIGGSTDSATNTAVTNVVAAGIAVIVAAGNNGGNACQYTPSGATNAIAVGATDQTDTLASYSNTGSCVSMYAPGSLITSLWIGQNGITNTISGTSMATPHVSGVAALFMGAKTYTTVAQLLVDIQSASTPNAVLGLSSTGSRTRLGRRMVSFGTFGGFGGQSQQQAGADFFRRRTTTTTSHTTSTTSHTTTTTATTTSTTSTTPTTTSTSTTTTTTSSAKATPTTANMLVYNDGTAGP